VTQIRSPSGGLAQWLAARARNALRRPLRIGGLSGLLFVVALVALVLVPRRATRAARLLAPSPADYPDTAAVRERVRAADSASVVASGALSLARARAARLIAADTLPTALEAERDSLIAEQADLTRALAHAELAPLPGSYRALGALPGVSADPRIRTLLDSLDDVARARQAFGTAGGADPVYVALTARVTAIGRTIQTIAEARRETVSAELGRLGGVRPSAPAIAAETLAVRARYDSVVSADSTARAVMAMAVQTTAVLAQRADRARELANVSAPPIALLAAAIVLGAAIGFGLTFGAEVAHPRVADAAEAERVSGVRTLAVVGPTAPQPERARRRTDHAISPLIDATSTEYRLLYLGLAGTGLPLVTVTGDESAVVATVAANIAVACALDSRATLLVDADPQVAAASAIVAARLAPGVSDVLAGAVSWAEAITVVAVGRDRSLDVVPAGGDPGAAWPADRTGTLLPDPRQVVDGGEATAVVVPAPMLSAETLRGDLSRLARRYDLVVIAAPPGLGQVGPASVLPGRDVIVTARIAYTTLERLGALAAELARSEMQLRGIVLWDADAAPPTPHRRTPLWSRPIGVPDARGESS
jgi:Mrp family chromosome partitioning ATPase